MDAVVMTIYLRLICYSDIFRRCFRFCSNSKNIWHERDIDLFFRSCLVFIQAFITGRFKAVDIVLGR